MASESTSRIITVALGVCIVCSVLVSVVSVALKPIQDENKKVDKMKNIVVAGKLVENDKDLKDKEKIKKIFSEKIETKVVDLNTGAFLKDSDLKDPIKPENYNIKKLAKDKEFGEKLSSKSDIAQIKRRPKYGLVYFVKDSNNKIDKIILPVYGKGLWSTMYGFIAVDKDLTTIKGLTFYEHGETPGLGGEIDNVQWKQSWIGKKIFDENDKSKIKIEVLKGQVQPGPTAKHQIDGLSGATLTTKGVSNLVRFWLGFDGSKWGDAGYGPFIKELRKGGFNG